MTLFCTWTRFWFQWFFAKLPFDNSLFAGPIASILTHRAHGPRLHVKFPCLQNVLRFCCHVGADLASCFRNTLPEVIQTLCKQAASHRASLPMESRLPWVCGMYVLHSFSVFTEIRCSPSKMSPQLVRRTGSAPSSPMSNPPVIVVRSSSVS